MNCPASLGITTDLLKRMEILRDGEVMTGEEERHDPDAGTTGSISYLAASTAKAFWHALELCGVT